MQNLTARRCQVAELLRSVHVLPANGVAWRSPATRTAASGLLPHMPNRDVEASPDDYDPTVDAAHREGLHDALGHGGAADRVPRVRLRVVHLDLHPLVLRDDEQASRDDDAQPRPPFPHPRRHRLPPVRPRVVHLAPRRREEGPRAPLGHVQPAAEHGGVGRRHVGPHAGDRPPRAGASGVEHLGGAQLELVRAVPSRDVHAAVDDAAGEEGPRRQHPRHHGPPVPAHVVPEHEVQRAVHVGDQPAADHERVPAVAGSRDGHAAEPARAGAVAARHGRDGVPAALPQVQHLPLDLARAAVERQREQPRRAQPQRPPLREEPGLVCQEMAPAPAHQPARAVGLHGQPQQAVQRRVVGEPRDQRLRRLPRRLLRTRRRSRGRRQAEPRRQLHLAVAELVDGRLVRGHPHATHAPPGRPSAAGGNRAEKRTSTATCWLAG
uniref:Uncharacterized protein n=1 Tax=Zea mays TaxID=4577 RepID=B7ZXS3_MAIZE|nr:unknown [Zea mays]ACL53032.1 unknown [Zea mays]ACL54111.1 unknown [Zea mays]ACN34208.1 unknown [Zea mays]ACN35837.1 unknown [Zea mays]